MDLNREAQELLEAASEASGLSQKFLVSQVVIQALKPYKRPVKVEMDAQALRKKYERAPF